MRRGGSRRSTAGAGQRSHVSDPLQKPAIHKANSIGLLRRTHAAPALAALIHAQVDVNGIAFFQTRSLLAESAHFGKNGRAIGLDDGAGGRGRHLRLLGEEGREGQQCAERGEQGSQLRETMYEYPEIQGSPRSTIRDTTACGSGRQERDLLKAR